MKRNMTRITGIVLGLVFGYIITIVMVLNQCPIEGGVGFCGLL